MQMVRRHDGHLPPSIQDVAFAARSVPCSPAGQAKPSLAAWDPPFALAAIARAHLTPLYWYSRETPEVQDKECEYAQAGKPCQVGLE